MILRILLICFVASCASAQAPHIDIFKGVTDDDLYQALVQFYTTSQTLSDSDMKDTLMARIYYDANTQQVKCVYTHHTRPLSPDSENPNQDVFDNGQASGLNVEHIFPRDKGAKTGLSSTDMHHLAPAKVNVNADRNNLPFADIPDSQTQRWYFEEREQSFIPATQIDEYSEWTNMAFEPREDYKGAVARAMFYFYTIYRNNTVDNDPEFFDLQRQTLCQWHYDFPTSQEEWDRTYRVAEYQDGIPNPFVLDCSLAGRLYCDEISSACRQLVSNEQQTLITDALQYANPTSTQHAVLGLRQAGRVIVSNMAGRTIWQSIQLRAADQISLPEFAPGVYVLQWIAHDGSQSLTSKWLLY